MVTYSPTSLYIYLSLSSRHHPHVGVSAANSWLHSSACLSRFSPLPVAGLHMQQRHTVLLLCTATCPHSHSLLCRASQGSACLTKSP